MARTTTAGRQQQTQAPPKPAPNRGGVAVIHEARLPYHPLVQERFGIDKAGWRALTDAIWPAAKTADAIVLALSYCKARNLDPFKRPVHIVPIYSTELGRMIESVWPGIGELRTTAFRTGLYAGREEPVFGPDHTATLDGVQITYPAWCKVTVYRLAKTGERMAYPGPQVWWRETYATAKKDTVAPNSMWRKRPRGQLEKCAEASALRAAFPEEIGNDYTADEMEGQIIDPQGNIERDPAPPRPTREAFREPETTVSDAEPARSYILVDLDGEEHEYSHAGDVERLLAAMFDEAAKRGRSFLSAVAENNLHAIAALREAGEMAIVERLNQAWNAAIERTEQTQSPSGDRPGAADTRASERRGEPDSPTVPGSAAPAGREKDATSTGQSPTRSATGEARDLLADPPAEDLRVPLLRNPNVEDLDYFARQMLAMIEERPADAQRKARIKAANDLEIAALKKGLVERYDEVMRALAGGR